MLKTELLEIIANGENSGVEFKRDDIRPEQLAKEIVALANFQGGKVLLGIDDDGTISGIQRADLEEWVMNIFQNKIHPMILPFYEEVKIDEKIVAIISFPIGISKPYVVRHAGKEDIYIRVGTTSRLATREQQMRLFELGGMLHTEVMPVPRTDISCLDDARLINYIRDILHDPEVPQSHEEWQSRLLGLGFLTKAADSICCTIAGLVLFGKSPRRYLKQAGIRLLSFDAQEKYVDAIICYQKALDINPNDLQFLDNMGTALCTLGDYKNAITYFDRSISIDPNQCHPWQVKAMALKELGLSDEAEYCNHMAKKLGCSDMEFLKF